MRPRSWKIRGGELPLDTPLVMGIVNVTPDSFSDGGVHLAAETATEAGIQMVRDGAVIVDVGGESTRPGAPDVPADVEIERVLPVVSALVSAGAVVSIDTAKAEVAQRCIESGAHIVNDVTALSDPDMASVCASGGVGVVLMHMLGTPATMQDDPQYADVVSEVASYLEERTALAIAAGIDPLAIAIDPGIGFGKTLEHNIDLLRNIDVLTRGRFPVVVGASRKRFLGAIIAPLRGRTTPAERDGATAGTVALGVSAGVSVVRVHNVPLAADVVATANAIVPEEAHEEESNRT